MPLTRCPVLHTTLGYAGGKYLSIELSGRRWEAQNGFCFFFLLCKSLEKEQEECCCDIVVEHFSCPLEQYLFLAASESKTKGVSIKNELSHERLCLSGRFCFLEHFSSDFPVYLLIVWSKSLSRLSFCGAFFFFLWITLLKEDKHGASCCWWKTRIWVLPCCW